MRYPLVQTGMGWVAGPRLVAATTRGGRAGHPGLGHHEPRRAGGGHRRGAQPDHGPLRRQPAHRRGRRARAHRADDRDGRPGGQLRPGAQPGPGDPLQGGRAVRHAHGRRPPPRREGGRVGRRRRHRPGRRGGRAHRDRPHHAPAPPGRRRRGRPRPGPRRRRLLQRPRPGGRPGLRRGRRRHGDPLPALGREPGARRRQGAVPRHAGDGHRGHDQGRRRAPAGRAHRPGRPPGVAVVAARAAARRCAAPTGSARRPAPPSRRCSARGAP